MTTTPSPIPAEQRHDPVLLASCLELITPALRQEGAIYVDGTLGMAGHAVAVLDAAPTARLVGIDRDADALELARERLERTGHAGRFDLVHTTYDEIPAVLAELGLPAADAIMLDLGLSSFQIDTRDRGFSYAADAPLDMRMDTRSDGPTAADLLRDLPEDEISRILHEYGDERFARRIARRIVRSREQEPLTRSGQLVDLLEGAIPAASRASGGHPAKRTFQALRIAVNEELEILPRALEASLDSVRVGGRVVVESYHSGEDRLVKSALGRRTRSTAPVDLPVELEQHRPEFREVTRGAVKADPAERDRNARSASVRLRAAERIRHRV